MLLGFGASGTLLCLARSRLLPRAEDAIFVLVLLTALAMPICLKVSQSIPVETRVIPALLGRQIGNWILYWGLLTVPFALGASAVGLALMSAGPRVPTVYAANLLGSGLGAILMTVFMSFVPPAWLATLAGVLVIIGAISLVRPSARLGALLVALVALATWQKMTPPTLRMDPFKYGAYVERLVTEGKARRVGRALSPRAVLEIYEGDVFHEFPFLSVGATPPKIDAVLMDGHWSGSLLQVRDSHEADAVERTLMALPYGLIAEKPMTLLLGETGGVNVWLASRHRASPIHVIQPDSNLPHLLLGPLRSQGGRVLELADVGVTTAEPRHYVDHTDHLYDLIHLSSMESWAVETGGVAGLHQNHLMTVEGMASCLRRLRPGGVLCVCRGIQLPPRDNLKILGTLIEALKKTGSEDPGRHIVMVRDYLGVCTLVRRAPWEASAIDRLREVIEERELTPVYFPGIRTDELNQPDMLPGPDGERGDWLHFGAVKLLSTDSDAFVREWSFDIRPPTDDRPFFGNFGKLSSVPLLRRTFGELWLTRTELSRVFVFAAMGVILVVGLILTIIPLGFLRDIRRATGRASTALYFTCIGLAYLMLEIVFLSKLTHLIGDPVRAGSVTIASFLVFSGLGSLAAQSLGKARTRILAVLIGLLVVVGLVVAWLVPLLARSAGGSGESWRMVLGALVVLPLAFLMGFPMPTGLARLQGGAPALIPWAWGINGFASVLAPPLATAVGMAWGFRAAGAMALGLYLLSAIAFRWIPSGESLPDDL